jgi:hypothetical protein
MNNLSLPIRDGRILPLSTAESNPNTAIVASKLPAKRA